MLKGESKGAVPLSQNLRSWYWVLRRYCIWIWFLFLCVWVEDGAPTYLMLGNFLQSVDACVAPSETLVSFVHSQESSESIETEHSDSSSSSSPMASEQIWFWAPQCVKTWIWFEKNNVVFLCCLQMWAWSNCRLLVSQSTGARCKSKCQFGIAGILNRKMQKRV